MDSPTLKLFYFNFRGRGEILRLLLHAANVDFSDYRVPASEWPDLKSNSPEGFVPFMEINGVRYGEYLPLARFIARKYNLMGTTELDQLTADIILNYVDDVRRDWVRFKTDTVLTAEQKKILQDQFEKETIPKFLSKIEKRLAESSSGFLAGDKLSIADLAVADVIDTLIRENPTVLGNFHKVSDHKNRIMGIPQLYEYLSTRPETKI